MCKTFISLMTLIFFNISYANAQITLGAIRDTISSGQLLELNAMGNRSGLKVASVALDSTTDVTTVNITGGIASAGTLIWNTRQTNHGKNDVIAGFYV